MCLGGSWSGVGSDNNGLGVGATLGSRGFRISVASDGRGKVAIQLTQGRCPVGCSAVIERYGLPLGGRWHQRGDGFVVELKEGEGERKGRGPNRGRELLNMTSSDVTRIGSSSSRGRDGGRVRDNKGAGT